MTPTEQWILGLFAVYSMPAYLLGVGTTILFIRSRGRAKAMVPSFLSPGMTFEGREFVAPVLTPADEGRRLLAQ